ncbi:MAG: hypothetical protein JL50_03010 [Peptococcaceae bacterium BICA1-7]|nr:MAG: hypothetical protein JL50_03010 [Peptococcaceae bacterium BICA1-7]
MAENLICHRCGRNCELPCQALNALTRLYTEARAEEKASLIKNLRKDLNLVDYEVAEDLRELGEKVIAAMPELWIIRDGDIKVGYVRSYEAKRDKGKQVNADCRKVRGTYTAYLPFDFIITFYEPNIYHMTENQKKILMLHELRHIGIGEKGLRIENHDVEDFKDILRRFGFDWNGFNQEVPDILAGGDIGKETKRNKMEAKPKANNTGRSPSKP